MLKFIPPTIAVSHSALSFPISLLLRDYKIMYVEPNHHLRIAFKNKHTSIHPYNFTFQLYRPPTSYYSMHCSAAKSFNNFWGRVHCTALYCTAAREASINDTRGYIPSYTCTKHWILRTRLLWISLDTYMCMSIRREDKIPTSSTT